MSASDFVEPLHQLEQCLRRQFIAGVHHANEFTRGDTQGVRRTRRPALEPDARLGRDRTIEIG